MAGLIGELVNEFTHQGDSQQPPPPQQGYGDQPPPLPPGWIARWDQYSNRYVYINEETGEETLERPYYRGGPPQGYGGGYEQEPPRREGGGHGMAYGAAGAAAGLVGGAVLMHEGENIEQDWDRDKYRVEDKLDDGVQDVENFPDDAAGWAGRQVGKVENIPQDVEEDYDRAKWGAENRIDDAVQDVQDIPQDIGQGVDDVSGWVGRKTGDVERFGDRVGNSFDAGEAQGRDDGW